MPMISVIASSETVSSVKCARRIAASVTSSDEGIAIITTIALRHERRKKSITMPVKMIASISVRTTPVVELLLGVRRLHVEHGELHVGIGAAQTRQRGEHGVRGHDLAHVPADFCTSSTTHGCRSEYA
jgi:hypothetical protein